MATAALQSKTIIALLSPGLYKLHYTGKVCGHRKTGRGVKALKQPLALCDKLFAAGRLCGRDQRRRPPRAARLSVLAKVICDNKNNLLRNAAMLLGGRVAQPLVQLLRKIPDLKVTH
jgi:hypothetical protein